MDIIVTGMDEMVGRFTLRGASPAFANAFRRSMISEVPTLAIEDVRIYDNNSALFDEMLAHRLGLIPIRTDLSAYSLPDQCACTGAGCPSCVASFTLSVEGPRTVYSRDLIPQDPETTPVNDDIPIVKLAEDQKVVLEARAVLGTGKTHAKWQPTVACGYKNYPLITIDERCDACGMCVEECPRQILEIRGKSIAVIEGRLEDCSLCRLCERACLAGGIGEAPAIHVTADTQRHLFLVESDGSLPVQKIMEEALVNLKRRSEEVIEILDEISGGMADEASS